jgi:carboxyl-terminal processing protease
VSRPPSLFKRVFLPVVFFFVLTAFLARLALDPEARGFFDPQFWQQWWRIGQVMELAHANYLHPERVSYDKLADSAVSHVLDGVDRYTTYMLPADYKDFLSESDQRFVGVGVEIERSHGQVEIYHVLPNSPAALGGWKEGDHIVKIGETDVRDYTVPAVADLLRGAENSKLQVTLARPGAPKPIESTITRGGFDVPNVRDEELRSDGVGYLKITQFGKQTGQEFADALSDLQNLSDQQYKHPLRGLVLDLRDNPGGLLDAAVDVLEPLLPGGELVVSTRGRDGQQDGSLPTTGKGDVHFTGPMVVLINNNSASAAEIVAGALQDQGRAVILGERSYGKGVVQTVMPLPDGGGLRLTTEAYYLPSGRTIQDIGITPDVPMSLSGELSDLLRLERSDLRHKQPDDFANSFGFTPRPDPEIETAAGLICAATPDQAK